MTKKDLAPFGAVAPVKRPQGAGPLLQWFNGLPAGKALAIGWHIQANRCSEDLSEALRKLGTPRITVLHKMTGELVEYWSLETCSLIVLCNGFDDTWTMRETTERDGIAWGWIDAKNHSKCKARVFIHELASAGYFGPFTLTLEGMITDEFLTAISRQFDVLDAYEKSHGGNKAPFYGFSIQLAPAEKPKMVGRNGKQSPIIPMVARIPEVIDYTYLVEHLAPHQLLVAIREQALIGKAIQWSIDVSQQISAGQDKESWETPEYEESLQQPKRNETLDNAPPSPRQLESIGKLAEKLRKEVAQPATYGQAAALIKALSKEYNSRKKS